MYAILFWNVAKEKISTSLRWVAALHWQKKFPVFSLENQRCLSLKPTALPCSKVQAWNWNLSAQEKNHILTKAGILLDRKSTRLNSSHVRISYAVFCLKKK